MKRTIPMKRFHRPSQIGFAVLIALWPTAGWLHAQEPAETQAEWSSLSAGSEQESKGTFQLPEDFALAFGGQYRVMAHATNFDRHSVSITDKQRSTSLTNLRLRNWLNLHDAKEKGYGAYLQFEVGHIFFGDDGDFPKTYGSGDDTGIETRRAYLWYKPTDDSLLRVGVLDWQDRFGERPKFGKPYWGVDAYDSFRAVLANSVWDFNVGGASLEGTCQESWYYRASLVQLGKGDKTLTGDGGAYLAAGDLDREVGSHLFGASVYFLKDNGDYSYGSAADFGSPGSDNDSSWDLWTGLRGHLKYGEIEPSFFGIFNYGETDSPNWKHTGWAAKAAVDMVWASTKLTVQALYASGDNRSSTGSSEEFRTIAQSERDNFGAQGYWSLLGLSSPRGPADVNDLGVGLQNRGLGLLTIQAAAETKLTENMNGNLALGWLQSAEDNPNNGSSDIGIEMAGELQWAMAKSLGLNVGVAYLFAGDFYRSAPGGLGPDDLFSVYTRLQIEF